MTLAATQVNLRDALAVWRRTVEVHLRLWKMNLIAPAIEPVFSVLAFAEILWAITHAALDTLIILIVLVVFGAATSLWATLAAIPLLVGSLFIAGLSLGFTAHIHDIDAFNIYMAAFFTVMLICVAWLASKEMKGLTQRAQRYSQRSERNPLRSSAKSSAPFAFKIFDR